MKNRILLAALIAALAVSAFAGCGKKDEGKDKDKKPAVSDTIKDDKDKDDKKDEEKDNKNDSDKNTDEKNDTDKNDKDTGKTDSPDKNTGNNGTSGQSKPNSGGNTGTKPSDPGAGNGGSTQPPVANPDPEPPKATPSASEVMAGIAHLAGGSISEMPSSLYADVYGIDASQFDSVSVCGAMINVKADEIIVIKAKDANGLNQAVSVLNNRKSTLMAKWEHYLPEQYELVKSSKVTTNGNYALYAVGANAGSIISAFLSATK